MNLKQLLAKHKYRTAGLALAFFIMLISRWPHVVERYYTQGVYPVVSGVLRFLFGWVPFSIGDIIYSIAVVFLLVWVVRGIKTVFRKRIQAINWKKRAAGIFFTLVWLFVAFYLLWGLNYSREGVTAQFKLPARQIQKADLDSLVAVLHERLNASAAEISLSERTALRNTSALADEAAAAYRLKVKEYPFLRYRPVSVKRSVFGELMNYTGIQGYYNPFSGEAQVNMTIPDFLLPSVLTHEIAHQVGYGSESEANFISFLVCRKNASPHFRYSNNFISYAYARNELYRMDSVGARMFDNTLHPQVKKDFETYRNFYRKYESRIEPVISWVYGNFLKANNQPAGTHSYNEVVVWLNAWYARYGSEGF